MKKFVIFIVVLGSCQGKPNIFEEELIKKGSRWVALGENVSIVNIDTMNSVCTIFKKNNTYINKLLNGKNVILPIDGTSTYTGTWDYSSKDSIFKINNTSFKLLKVLPDTIYLLNKYSSIKIVNFRKVFKDKIK